MLRHHPFPQAAIIDLDDTLYDCHGSLVPIGHRCAAEALRRAGVPASVAQIEKRRAELHEKKPSADIDELLVAELGGPPEAAEEGRRAFFSPRPITGIHPFPGVLLALERLREAGIYLLLMTRGIPKIQRQKIKTLGLATYFDRVIVVGLDETKQAAMEAWLASSAFSAHRVLVVGDRPNWEIAAGRRLGMTTVRVLWGEHKAVLSDSADFNVESVTELPALFGLQLRRFSAPCRVDLGGGTLDIWPIAALIAGGVTVNAAISLRQAVEFRPTIAEPLEVRVVSAQIAEELRWRPGEATPARHPLALFAEALGALPPPWSCVMELTGSVPRGSGLGGSSALLVAALRGLLSLRRERWSRERLVEVAHNLEARALGVPTGIQDYLAADSGGFLAVSFDDAGHGVQAVALDPAFRERLEASICLFYAGEPHFSAVPNWLMLKAAVEDPKSKLPLFRGVAEAAREVLAALTKGDEDRLAVAFAKDWENRRALAEGVSTPALERQIQAAILAGARGVKVCGAGGGGTFLALVPESRRLATIDAVERAGGSYLPAVLGGPGFLDESHEKTPSTS